jgi:hypothetical protein
LQILSAFLHEFVLGCDQEYAGVLNRKGVRFRLVKHANAVAVAGAMSAIAENTGWPFGGCGKLGGLRAVMLQLPR